MELPDCEKNILSPFERLSKSAGKLAQIRKGRKMKLWRKIKK